MTPLENAVRYTTWFGTLEGMIIPLYLLCVFACFGTWLWLSFILRSSEKSSYQAGNAQPDEEEGLSSLRSMTARSRPAELQSSMSLPIFSVRGYQVCISLRLLSIRLLAVVLSIIFWCLHLDILKRLRFIMNPLLYITIALYILQWAQLTSFPGFFGLLPAYAPFRKAEHLCINFSQTLRKHSARIVTARRMLHFQIAVAVIACSAVVVVFLNNEPLTRTLPPTVGVPRRMCGPNSPSKDPAQVFADYIAFHREMMARPTEDQRILIYHTPDEGLGNRLEGLVSAFALSVVTKRAFLVDWRSTPKCGARLWDLFEEPGFPWIVRWEKLNEHIGHKEGYYYAYCRACPIRTRQPDLTVTWEKILCQPGAGFDETARIIDVRSTQWFAPIMAMNPHLKAVLCEHFGADIYGNIAPFLLKLNSQLQGRLDDFKKATQWRLPGGVAEEVVSLQIRRLEGNGVSEDFTSIFLRCAAAIGEGGKTRKFFLATDHIPTRHKFKQLLGDRLLNVDSEFDRSSVMGIQDAVLEMYLLGEATEMVMSPYSTYGDVAHARTKLTPHKVSRTGQCMKSLNSHPCFFYYFGLFDLKCFRDDMAVAELTNHENCYL